MKEDSMNTPDMTAEERDERNAFVARLRQCGVTIELIGPDETLIMPGRKDCGVLLLVNDDPVTGTGGSRGPDAFPMLAQRREGMTHCLIESGFAPLSMLTKIEKLIRDGGRMMWITTREEQEIAWTHWASDPPTGDHWRVLSVLSQPDTQQ
jgi:hypothetical protein